MAVSDIVTDDIMAYCLERHAELNRLRYGEVVFVFQDSHLVSVRVVHSERIGSDVSRDLLDQRRADLRKQRNTT